MSENGGQNLEKLREKIKNATLVRHTHGTDIYYIFDNDGLIAQVDGGDLVQMLMPNADYEFTLDLEETSDKIEYDF
ncbi:hypothetical protein GCM10023093_27450 [Nemorincola caseinilytica]|uniref:Uncharacterized protein n=1 Tax=Nemorincola caseinilytica TaxID=2054315 RepID=A0ABP8NMR0_9BACT